ncbi:MAG: chemotaxis protein CheW [Desulfuromonas sp.]|nr:MAG: chemotaxis protein CheW [Desulfuromonas sp.]
MREIPHFDTEKNVKTNVEMCQYLTFKLDKEAFGVDVSHVREVLDEARITKVPQTPEYMLGVINLRGSVVPVVDLRMRFGLSRAEKTRDTCIVVLEVNFDGELVVVGAQTDAVEEVLSIHPEQIEPPPQLGNQLKVDYIQGMGKVADDNFVMLLHIDNLFTAEELEIFWDSRPAEVAV